MEHPEQPYTPAILEPLQIDEVSSMVDHIRTNTTGIGLSNTDYASFESNKNNAFNTLIGGGPTGPSFQNEGFKVGEAYDRLSDGMYNTKYPNFLQGTDNEQRFAEDQSNTQKWTRGIGKFFGKTGTAILGATVGSIYGIAEALAEGDFSSVMDNDFTDVMDDWNKSMDNSLANYYTKEERDMGFFQAAGTANFWANDFLGGLSFTVGAIASEAIWAAATGGASIAVRAARFALRGANTLNKGKKALQLSKGLKNHMSKMHGVSRAKKYGMAGEALNTARYFYTSAGYEAGVEARMYQDEQLDSFYRSFEELGRKPTVSELSEFQDNLLGTTNVVFATNLALVGSSNLAIFGKMFNITSPLKLPKSQLSKYLFGNGIEITDKGVKQAIKRNLAQRIAGTTVVALRAPVIEGVYEEGLQSVTATSAGAFMDSSYGENKATLGMMESIYEGFSHTYGTKQGWKEVGLGMLIGAFGGGASAIGTGRNPFSSIIDAGGKTSKAQVAKADILNNYSAKKLANGIFRANAIQASNEEGDKAVRKGDLFGQEAARTMGMMANIIYSDRMGYGDEMLDELLTEIDNYEAKDIAANLGITVAEATQMKEDSKEDYKNLRDSYTKAKDFANYVIGKGRIDKDNEINADQAREMIAYQMVMAERAESISRDFIKAISNEVGDFGSESILLKSTLEVEDILNRATRADRKIFKDLQKEHREALKKMKAAERQLRTQTSRKAATPEGNQAIAAELNALTAQISEQQEALIEIESKLEEKINALSIHTLNIDSEGFISGSQLAKLEENIAKFDDFLVKTEQRDKPKAARIKKYLEEYQKSLQGVKQYSAVIEGLLNPETGATGQSRTFLKKLKDNNNPTEQLINALKAAQEDFAVGQAPIFVQYEQPVAQVKPEVDDMVEESGVTEVDGMEVATPTTAVESRPETIEDAIKNAIDENQYILENFGEDIDGKRPTQEDIDRLNELIDKMNIDPDTFAGESFNTVVKRGLKKIGLSKEELQEFMDLNQKLADWRIVEGSVANGVSVAELLEQKRALETEVSYSDITPMSTEEDIEVALGPKEGIASSEMSSEDVNTADTAMVLKRGKKVLLTHLKPSYFTDKGAVLRKNGNVIPVPQDGKLEKGDYTFDIGDVTVAFTSVGHSRMSFSEGEFNKLKDAVGLEVISVANVKGTLWSVVYEKREDGKYQPLLTDYAIKMKGSEYNILDPQKLYDLKEGEELFFKVSLNDDFNMQLEDAYVEAFQNYEEDSSKANKKRLDRIIRKIERQASIHVVNSNGDVIGQLKAKADDVISTKEFEAIREFTSKLLLDKFNPDTARAEFQEVDRGDVGDFVDSSTRKDFTLPFATKVTGMFIGTPNMVIEKTEDGAVPSKIDFTEETIEMIDGFGVIENGEITMNEGTPVPLKSVNKQFVGELTGTNPIVVINYKNQKIAYPITLKESGSTLIVKIEALLATDHSIAKKTTELIKLLAENGVDPISYRVRYTSESENFFNTPSFDRLLTDVENMTDPIDKGEYLSKDFKKADLVTTGQITVDLTNNPFQSPKVKIDLTTPSRHTEITSKEEEDHFDVTGKVEGSRIDEILNELKIKAPNELSPFNKKVLRAYKKHIEKRLGKSVKLPAQKKSESKKEENKKC